MAKINKESGIEEIARWFFERAGDFGVKEKKEGNRGGNCIFRRNYETQYDALEAKSQEEIAAERARMLEDEGEPRFEFDE